MIQPIRATHRAAAAALLTTVLVLPAAAQETAAPSGAHALARQEITDLLASNAIQRVDIQAKSYDAAAALVGTVADTYLAAAEPPLGGAAPAGEYGVAVINGLNDHNVKGAVRIFGGASLVVGTPDDARNLGTLLAVAAEAIHRAAAAASGRVQLRDTAKNLFDAVMVNSESTEPLLGQYLTRVKEIAAGPQSRIASFVVVAPGT